MKHVSEFIPEHNGSLQPGLIIPQCPLRDACQRQWCRLWMCLSRKEVGEKYEREASRCGVDQKRGVDVGTRSESGVARGAVLCCTCNSDAFGREFEGAVDVGDERIVLQHKITAWKQKRGRFVMLYATGSILVAISMLSSQLSASACLI